MPGQERRFPNQQVGGPSVRPAELEGADESALRPVRVESAMALSRRTQPMEAPERPAQKNQRAHPSLAKAETHWQLALLGLTRFDGRLGGGSRTRYSLVRDLQRRDFKLGHYPAIDRLAEFPQGGRRTHEAPSHSGR